VISFLDPVPSFATQIVPAACKKLQKQLKKAKNKKKVKKVRKQLRKLG
jgi:hypothetical protein